MRLADTSPTDDINPKSASNRWEIGVSMKSRSMQQNRFVITFSFLLLSLVSVPVHGAISDYSPQTDVVEILFIASQLSGATYNPDSNTLFLIQNSGSRLWEVDLDFNLVREISIGGFGDSEDIAYLGNGEFAIVNENSELYVGVIDEAATSLSASTFQKITFDSYRGSDGPEGVTYNPETGEFFIVKERNPKRIFTFLRPAGSEDTTVTPSEPFDAETLPIGDLAAVNFDADTGRLFILSQASKKIVEVLLDGTVLDELSVAELSHPEGIAINGSFLYVVGEPDEYQVFGSLMVDPIPPLPPAGLKVD